MLFAKPRQNRRPVLVVGPLGCDLIGDRARLIELAVVHKHLCQTDGRHALAGVLFQALAPECFGLRPILGLLRGAGALPQVGGFAAVEFALRGRSGPEQGIVAVALLNHAGILRDLSRDKEPNALYKARSGVKDNR